MTIGFGIVGCGMIAGFHARALAEMNNAKLVACTSRSPDAAIQFAKQHNCLSFATLDDMLKSKSVDAVCICTPSGAHLEPALSAAKAGKHLVIEKPLEITPERCDQIIDACAANNVLLTTIFQSRFHPAAQKLKQAVELGRFGQLSLGSAYVKWCRTQEYYDSGAWRGTWHLDGGGALMNQAIHNIDLLQWIMGPVAEVSAFAATLSHQRIEVEDTLVAILKFQNGALGTIEATTAAHPGWLKRLEICGANGSAILEDDSLTWWKFAERLSTDDEMPAGNGTKHEANSGGATNPAAIGYIGHRKQLADFVEAIKTGRAPVVDGPEAKKSVTLIAAIYQSVREGRPVRV